MRLIYEKYAYLSQFFALCSDHFKLFDFLFKQFKFMILLIKTRTEFYLFY